MVLREKKRAYDEPKCGKLDVEDPENNRKDKEENRYPPCNTQCRDEAEQMKRKNDDVNAASKCTAAHNKSTVKKSYPYTPS